MPGRVDGFANGEAHGDMETPPLAVEEQYLVEGCTEGDREDGCGLP